LEQPAQESNWSPHEQALKALVSAAIRLQLSRTLQCASPDAQNVHGNSQRTGAQHDWNNVPVPAEHSNKRNRTEGEGEPIDPAAVRNKHVTGKPDSEIHDDTHNGGSDRRKRGRQF
jgi:hypothetical protein